MSKPILTTVDRTRELKALVDSFKHDAVLVGITEEKSDRKTDEEDTQINNATLLAINEFGSPVNNIPPRHPMTTGLRLVRNEIADEFRKAASVSLSQGIPALQKYYNRAGIIASQSVKSVINNQIDMDGPSKATLAARLSRKFLGTKALIVTGQMRNAITYVVTGKW